MKLKTAKANPKTISKAKKLVKGLTLEWEDATPLADRKIARPKVGHSNPITRLFADKILADFSNTIFKNMRFKWRVTIKLFFRLEDKNEIVNIFLDSDCILDELNDVCMAEIKDEIKQNKYGKFYNSHFFIECIGL